MKEFRVVLAPLPDNGYLTANSDVTGHVLLVTDEVKSGYKAIEVTLKGYAAVDWELIEDNERTVTYNNEATVTYNAQEDYIANTTVLWSNDSAPGGQIAPGSYKFQFSLRFQADGGPLPPSFHGNLGKIVYEVEAVIIKTAALNFNTKFAVELPYSPAIAADPSLTPGVLEPKILQVQKTVCYLCCASGPISITARIPRSGYCIGEGDTIPLEVDIENGSSRQIRQLQAILFRMVTYTAHGNHVPEQKYLLVVSSGTPIQPGNSSTWRPPPLSIPDTEPSIATCKIINLGYILTVRAIISGAINNLPNVNFNLFLGNVPVSGIDSSQPLPYSVPPATAPYPAPPVPIASQGTPYPPDPTPYPQPIPQPAAFAPPPASGFSGLPPGFVDPIKR